MSAGAKVKTQPAAKVAGGGAILDLSPFPEDLRHKLAGRLAGRALRRAFPSGELMEHPSKTAWAVVLPGFTAVALGTADGNYAAYAGYGLDHPGEAYPHSNAPDAALLTALEDALQARVADTPPETIEEVRAACKRLRALDVAS